MSNPIIYLDIDGVLNGHERHPNGYCGMKPSALRAMNYLLAEVPEAMIVVTSAWRYLVHNQQMTVTGLESLLLTHGLACHRRIAGITGPDEPYWPPNPTEDYADPSVRVRQIEADVAERKPGRWLVLDDLPLPMDRLLKTNGGVGLTAWECLRAVEMLRGDGGV